MRARVNSCTKYTMRIVCSSSHRFISILCCSEFMCEWSNQGEFHSNNNGYSIYLNISACISRTCVSDIWLISVKNIKYMMIIHPKIKDLFACHNNFWSCHTRTLNKCIICTHICCRCRHSMFFLSVLFCLFIWQSQKLSTSVRVSPSNKKDPHIGSLI